MSFLRRLLPIPTPEGDVGARTPSLQIARLLALWRRIHRFADVFRQSGLGMAGLIILLIFTGMAVSAPLLTSVGLLRAPDASLCGADFHACRTTDPDLADYRPPDGTVWLGTDHLGRDIFARLWWGTQFTVIIGLMASVLSMGLGTFVGMMSGYYGGWVDEALMRVTDFFLVLPTLVLALILSGILVRTGGGSLWTTVFVIGISLWAFTARLVRAQVLSLKQRQFIERARSVGAGSTRIVWRHLFPNAFSLVFAEAILTIAVAILTESFLSFLHLGPVEVTTWGKIIDDANSHNVIILRLYWWIFAPGFAIVIVVMAFTLLGYALDEIFNPRLRRH
jgi:peptide/nickel transport system permease protein